MHKMAPLLAVLCLLLACDKERPPSEQTGGVPPPQGDPVGDPVHPPGLMGERKATGGAGLGGPEDAGIGATGPAPAATGTAP